MKLRSMMFVSASALVAAAFASDVLTDDKTLGWMRVESGLAVTAVGVPWVDVANTNNDIKVANLIKTDNLTDGDNLYVYNNGNWTFYTKSGSAWVAGTTANSSITATAGTPSTATIARGQAVYLERLNPTTGSVTNAFYLYGAVGGAVPNQTLQANKTYLLASPKAQPFVISTSTIENATARAKGVQGDQIVVPLADGASRVYTLVGSTWGYSDSTGARQTGEAACTVPLGTGFWYNTAAGSTPTIKW